MGLDMYAHRRWNTKQYGFEKPELHYEVTVTRGGELITGIKFDRVSSVEEEVMYWRKANAIHGWFVNHVQDGIDDCLAYNVTLKHLEQLRDDCQAVISASTLEKGLVLRSKVWNANHENWDEHRESGYVIKDSTVAEKLLPTYEGFFFGSYAYDQEYLSDVMRTRDWAIEMLDTYPRWQDADLYYSSSW